MIAQFIVMAVIGLAIGVLSGTLGIGGGMIMVPLFRLAFGMSPIASTATSLFTIIPTSVSGAVSHIRGKTCVPKLGVALGAGGALTSPIGVQLAQISPEWLVMVAAAAVIAYSSITMLRKALRMPAAGAEGRKSNNWGQSPIVGERKSDNSDNWGQSPNVCAGRGQQAIPQVPTFSNKQLAGAVGIGALAGVASGYVGLGGGFIMVPLMASVLNMPMKLTSGTSLIAVMILATPATIAQCLAGNVNLLVGIAMACGSIPGAILGAKLVKRLPERTLRFIFAAFLLLAAILLVVKETGVLG